MYYGAVKPLSDVMAAWMAEFVCGTKEESGEEGDEERNQIVHSVLCIIENKQKLFESQSCNALELRPGKHL